MKLVLLPVLDGEFLLSEKAITKTCILTFEHLWEMLCLIKLFFYHKESLAGLKGVITDIGIVALNLLLIFI